MLQDIRRASYGPHYGGICLETQPPICSLAGQPFRGHSRRMLEERIRGNLIALRQKAGLSRPQLAALCVPPTTYKQIEKLESGERHISLEWLERLSIALKIDVELLCSGRPEFSLAEPVADEVAGAIALVATGTPPDETTKQQISLMLQALIETFVRHPEARGDLGAARPVVDFLARQFAR